MNLYVRTIFQGMLCLILVPAITSAQVTAAASCNAPSGSIIAQYSTGIHGIVGDSGVYTGSDTVYAIDENNVLQCFCPDDSSSGIQTNWVNAATFSIADIASYSATGWIYIPSGIAWGLADAPFIAKNSAFNCSAIGGDGSEEIAGTVLGASTKKITLHSVKPSPRVKNTRIAMLPSTGTNIVVAFAVFLVAGAVVFGSIRKVYFK